MIRIVFLSRNINPALFINSSGCLVALCVCVCACVIVRQIHFCISYNIGQLTCLVESIKSFLSNYLLKVVLYLLLFCFTKYFILFQKTSATVSEPNWLEVKGGKLDPATGRMQISGVKVALLRWKL